MARRGGEDSGKRGETRCGCLLRPTRDERFECANNSRKDGCRGGKREGGGVFILSAASYYLHLEACTELALKLMGEKKRA